MQLSFVLSLGWNNESILKQSIFLLPGYLTFRKCIHSHGFFVDIEWVIKKGENTHCTSESGLWLLFGHFARLKPLWRHKGGLANHFAETYCIWRHFRNTNVSVQNYCKLSRKCKPKILFHCLRKKLEEKETGYQVFPTWKTMYSLF